MTRWLIFCAILIGRMGWAADELPAGIEVRDYTGWPESIFLNATEKPAQAVIVPAVGGRLVHYSLGGENIIFENPAAQGKTMGAKEQDLWIGGYQCEISSADPTVVPPLLLTQGVNIWKPLGNFAVQVSSPLSAGDIVLQKEFLLAPDTGDLGLTQRIQNVSSNAHSYYLQDRTECKSGGYVFFPLNKKSRYKSGWAQLRQTNGVTAYDGDHPDVFQARVLNGVLVIAAGGGVTKIGADDVAGWVAYAWEKLLLVKYFPTAPEGSYADGGNNLEVYFDLRSVQLCPFSPETKLAPGQSFTFPEKWTLMSLPKAVNNWDDARRLVRRIPPSPFKQ